VSPWNQRLTRVISGEERCQGGPYLGRSRWSAADFREAQLEYEIRIFKDHFAALPLLGAWSWELGAVFEHSGMLSA